MRDKWYIFRGESSHRWYLITNLKGYKRDTFVEITALAKHLRRAQIEINQQSQTPNYKWIQADQTRGNESVCPVQRSRKECDHCVD